MDCITLRNVTLPKNLRIIRKDLFRNCIALTHIDLPAGFAKIKKDAFEGCLNLKRLNIPDGGTEIPARSFFIAGALGRSPFLTMRSGSAGALLKAAGT